MKELEYPFDSKYITKKKKSLRRQLLADGSKRINKKIAILGGSTTNEIMLCLELFLLNQGIEPSFYESEYNMYWQDAMFPPQELLDFSPDIIFIHTSSRNITNYPTPRDTADSVKSLLDEAYGHFAAMWKNLEETFHCPIIQNNFEQPFYRLMGNSDVSDYRGRLNFVHQLNTLFYEYAQTHESFYINDINYMASCYGLQRWSNPFYYHMYKYVMDLDAVPEFSYNLANIIKSIYGKNKKAFVLDMDNTLWGGVVGDDGPENIEIGQETSTGQLYAEWQSYLKAHQDLGVLLTVNSKNDEENALAGLNRPDSILKPEDFIVLKANWENKDRNIVEIASELNIGTDALVFVDDNPVERGIVSAQVPSVAVPEVGDATTYLQTLDRCGFFEVTNFSSDDLKRNDMYKANAARKKQEASFGDYKDYLRSLEMVAEIDAFSPNYMARIAQLTNKSNQFNLTTKRCTQDEIEGFAADPNYITLYGKLYDKFGDNGVVSVVFGHVDDSDTTVFHIDLWLMSCRVLKRDMEVAMMDSLVARCMERGITKIYGYYYPTAKNAMVKNFYADREFTQLSCDSAGNTVWEFAIPDDYQAKNEVMTVKKEMA